MTAAKNVYALMLALVIVLSGCFGNTANDTDAQEPGDTADSGDDSGPEMIAVGGFIQNTSDFPGDRIDSEVHTINTSAGQIVQMHESRASGSGTLRIITECTDGASFMMYGSSITQYAPGSYTNCSHTIQIYEMYLGTDVSWSFVYLSLIHI